VLLEWARCGVADDLVVEERVRLHGEGRDARSNRRRPPLRGQEISRHPTADQDSCDSNTCIANNVLSKRAWNVSLPRLVKRSSPKSNFISL
jgi:hypothetical protein